MKECVVLAFNELGDVRRCQVGCTHLTFAGASLHFESFDEFVGFADVIRDEATRTDSPCTFEIAYRWFSVRLGGEPFYSLHALVEAAVEEAAWRGGEMTSENLSLASLSRPFRP